MQMLIGQILGEISEDEVSNGRPMFNTIVVGVKGVPGEGFYSFARDLGRHTAQADLEFWESEEKAVYDTWKVKLWEEKKLG